MSHERMHEISTEMCSLLDQQCEFLNSPRVLNAMSAEEVEGYAHRNDRLNQLSRELSEILLSGKKESQPEKDTRCPMSDVWG